MTINKSTKSQIIHGRIEGKLQGLDLTTPLYLGTVTQFVAFCGYEITTIPPAVFYRTKSRRGFDFICKPMSLYGWY